MSTLIHQIFYQPVSEVDVGCSIGWGDVFFEEVADFEGGEAVVELGFTSGGEPEVLGH